MLPVFQIEAMRAKEPKNRKTKEILSYNYLDNPNYYLEFKSDGSRTLAYIRFQNNIIQMVGKSYAQEYEWFKDTIYKELYQLVCSGTILDCETTWIKKDSNMDSFLTVEAKTTTAIEKGFYEVPELRIFDVIFLNGIDMRDVPYEERKALLKKLIPDTLKYVKYVPYFENKREIYEDYISKGGEGVILKLKGSPYISDKKESEKLGYWIKVKKSPTEDCVIVGCSIGKGWRTDTFGSAIIAQYLQNGKLVCVGKTSGFKSKAIDDSQLSELDFILKEILANRIDKPVVDNYNDTDELYWCNPILPIEVTYLNRMESSGYLRNPRFFRFRYDKKLSDCIYYK